MLLTSSIFSKMGPFSMTKKQKYGMGIYPDVNRGKYKRENKKGPSCQVRMGLFTTFGWPADPGDLFMPGCFAGLYSINEG